MYLTDLLQYKEPFVRLIHRRRLEVGRNVWFLGFTSLCTDISSEMVTSVLPAYVVLHLGLSPLGFGTIDGLYQGVASVVLWIGGAAADKSRRHRDVAAAGYTLSAICKVGLLVAGSSWAAIVSVIAVDRMGKGLRTAPRDALISLSTDSAHLGTAFGVHRALDTTGAFLGPLAAFLVLALVPRSFDSVFVVSFSIALVGIGIVLLFVKNVPIRPGAAGLMPRRQASGALLRDAKFRNAVIGASVLSVATVSDGFIYLALQNGAHFGLEKFPLLALATAGGYLFFAIPAGRLADRVGRAPVFVLGHAIVLGIYAMLLLSAPGVSTTVVCVMLLGAYYAMTDGVLAAGVSSILEPARRGTGLSLLGMGVSVSRLLSSVIFGWVWTMSGMQSGVMVFAGALVVALPIGMWFLADLDRGQS